MPSPRIFAIYISGSLRVCVAGRLAVFSSDGSGSSARQVSEVIDLASIRDTLRYIESDLRETSEYARLHAIVELALSEIERMETPRDHAEKAAHRTARFVPLRP